MKRSRETGQFCRLIRPRVYPQIHYRISEVTHMDMAELERNGETFVAVIRDFLQWCGDDCVFCTWGVHGLDGLQRNMAYYGVEIPFDKPLLYYDVQLYSLLQGDGKQKQSLDITARELGIREDRPFHRALDDAHYTGRVMAAMDFERVMEYWSTDYYRLPESKEEEVYLVFPGYSKYISRTFETKEGGDRGQDGHRFNLLPLQPYAQKEGPLVLRESEVLLCPGRLPGARIFKGKIRMKRSDDGRVYAVKTMKLVDEEGARQISEKKEEAKKNALKRRSTENRRRI